MSRRLQAISLAILLACTATARADVAFDNFDPGMTFTTGTGWTVSGPTSPVGSNAPAGEFTALASGQLTDLVMALSYVSGTNGVTVTLYDDNSGTPGTSLESWSLTNLPSLGTSFTPQTLTSIAHPILTAGDSYWVGVNPGSDDTWAAWNLVSTYTSPPGALQVDVVPEPSSVALLGLGTLAWAGVRTRRRASAA